MKRLCHLITLLPVLLAACQSTGGRETIARLRDLRIEIKEEKFEGGLEKAMQGYESFLQESPDSALAPEAIRRLADLKIEKEYGSTGEGRGGGERQALGGQPVEAPAGPEPRLEAANDLERVGAREAIALYQKLLEKYPLYERNDQVLYQMSRAYEELGETQPAMQIMQRLIKEYPGSRYLDEVQFRRAEYFFAHKRYLDAEEAYGSIVKTGSGSFFYDLALYKLGWTFYKQEMYEEAQHRFIALLDYKVSVGYDFTQTQDEQERKRMDDTFRVVSLSFSNLGGPEAAAAYFSRRGARSYEDSIYSNLTEFYFDKRRYADAAAACDVFISHNPFHKSAPDFQMRIIEIHDAGGFPSLVLDAKKKFASAYGLKADYWKHFDPQSRPEVLKCLKTNLNDLATFYHAGYQDPEQVDARSANFKEALRWYREFLVSFPSGDESPGVNFQMAGLLLENHLFGAAAEEYEKTAYGYAPHEKAAQAGYGAVYAFRQQLAEAGPDQRDQVKREAVRSSLKFADTFPDHEKAAVVLGAAADDLFLMKQYREALAAAGKLLERFPGAAPEVRRPAFLVVAHSSYELLQYSQAEAAYQNVLAMLPDDDPSRSGLTDNLAASIYKQGEQANASQDYRAAARHFLRVGLMAPGSAIRPTAEFDAAAALIQTKDWQAAAEVLGAFRTNFPGHALQPEVTKKLALVYREEGRLSLAAAEFERIEQESGDDEIRRDALLVAADLHEKAGDRTRTMAVYRRYVAYFPQPVELNLETRNKCAEIMKAQGDHPGYLEELRQIVSIDAAAGAERTPRTIYLAAQAGLVLAAPKYEAFTAVALVQPIEENLRKKRDLMKAASQAFNQLLEYNVGEVTAAATFHLAEIYAHFSKALTGSQRPENLTPQQLEQYELAIEEQAYPFEEKAIAVHENNLKLIQAGVYNEWVKKSLHRLAEFMPARYGKTEENSAWVASLESYSFEIMRPVSEASLPDQPAAYTQEPPPAEPQGPQPARSASQAQEKAPASKTGPAESPSAAPALPLTGETEEAGAAEKIDKMAKEPQGSQAAEEALQVQTPPPAEHGPALQQKAGTCKENSTALGSDERAQQTEAP